MAPREINTEEHWEALPVGTRARVEYFETGDGENDDRVLFATRVEGEFLAAAGQHYLAGGSHWSQIWTYQQRTTVSGADSERSWSLGSREDAITQGKVAAKEAYLLNRDAQSEWEAKTYEERTYNLRHGYPSGAPPVPWIAVVDALLEQGWEPPVQVPEDVQVWTVTGKPAKEVRADGTMAYLSLPNGERWLEMQDRGDIWLEDPVVTVINERPRKEV